MAAPLLLVPLRDCKHVFPGTRRISSARMGIQTGDDKRGLEGFRGLRGCVASDFAAASRASVGLISGSVREWAITPEAYRELFGLTPDYPMAAPAYSRLRSEIAHSFGLGRSKKAPTRRRRRKGQA